MVRNNTNLPPGFRFHPTDEELIMHYLKNQATSRPCPVSIIPEVDIYKFDPWQLPEKSEVGENECYFFTPRDRKYPNGVRPNRAAVSGYWKATGTDKAIYSGSKYVGVKKALVFYKGRPTKSTKTDWIMHEYRLNESKALPNKHNGSMRLDDWVLCRIYKKKNMAKIMEQQVEESLVQISTDDDDDASGSQTLKFPRTFSISHLLEMEYLGSLPQLLGDNASNSKIDHNQNIMSYAGNFPCAIPKPQLGEVPCQYTDSMKFQVNQSNILNQTIFLNPVFEFQ